ncbi:MAG: pyridoxal phosphate-dependent aminotransferase [Candidatus Zixiibacteriota bacterium]
MIVKKVVIDKANRIYQFPPDVLSFSKEKSKRTLLKRTEFVDLARFHWPIQLDKENLPSEIGFHPAGKKRINQLKEALGEWFYAHHKVKINSLKEIFIGGKISQIIFNIALAFIDNGDLVFVPELGIPLYKKVITACGGEAVSYSVTYKNHWLPDFERINTKLGRVARLLFLNSPHNPTGVVLNEKELENLIWLASKENIVIVNDAAYQSISGRTPSSLMGINGGKKVGIEVYSFAYQFGLPAFPFGFVIGNKDIINGLEQSSQLLSTTVPDYYIDLALKAIRHFPNQSLLNLRKQLIQSSAEANRLLELLSMEKSGHDTIPFIWAKIERRQQARTKAHLLYRRNRILTAPGTGFGDSGEGFLRFSLTASPDAYKSAYSLIKKKLRMVKFKIGEER